MAYTEDDLYQIAHIHYNAGRVEMARKIMLRLYQATERPDIRLKALMAIVVPLNHVEPDKTISLCDEGLALAKSLGSRDETAYLSATKGYALQIKALKLVHKMGEYTLPPGWFAFSNETEKQKYETLKSQAEGFMKGKNRLFHDAETIARDLNDPRITGHVLMMKGEASGSEFYIVGLASTSKMRFRRFIKHVHIFPRLFFRGEQWVAVKKNMNETKRAFLESAKAFIECKDYSNAGYSLYNLANQNRGFSSAMYIVKAERLAKQVNDIVLQKQCASIRGHLIGYYLFKGFSLFLGRS